ncbi:MAG: DUF3990 domain-containing protein [Oscillospiraceae bacterium]|jgi:hypothetical protein|nr:DUF3990 domain-containing protein [Oscillospiraceae bacterium]
MASFSISSERQEKNNHSNIAIVQQLLYHGSYIAVEKPDLSFSRLRTDFGKGFYLTPLKEQAKSWADRFLIDRGTAFISTYSFLFNVKDEFLSDIRILEFKSQRLIDDYLQFKEAEEIT